MDYKDTINLPQTDFPMKAALAQREPKMLANFQANKLYERIQQATAERPTFILHDGPPYANGDIHLGHAVNKILKDFVVRARLLDGYRAPYVPGWDCHGLPIELQVEKKHGKVGRKIDAKTFRQKCREYAGTQIERQRVDFQRLGGLADWHNPYATRDFSYEANMLRGLSKIVQRGHLKRGVKPVHWCFDCGSALAEAEIEYQDKQSIAIDVLFEAVEPTELAARFGVDADDQALSGIVIWTTTPWTIPANQAVALNAELDYQLIEAMQQGRKLRLVVAEALRNAVVERLALTDVQVLAGATGDQLEHLRLKHAYNTYDVPVILGEHVTTETGTGAVHTAPGHGQEDFEVGKAYGLPVVNPIDGRGVFLPETPEVGGEFVWKANERLVEIMRERGTLLAAEPFEHSYPHCWRHKTPTAFRTTPQWFIGMDQAGLRQDALNAIESVQWVPDWGQARIHGMVESRPDWCISRQRTWGVPLGLLIDRESHEPHPDTPELLNKLADLVEQEGVDCWYEDNITERLGVDAARYEPVPDILDVWFDSGVTHFCVLSQREELAYPADLYLEGSDQHRGWFQSSLLTAIAIHGQAPYRAVLTHGFTVDADGRKMSKSLGNVVGPQQIMNTLGADILRLWVAATDYRQEMSVSDEILKRVADAYRRIRNTARFLLGNLHDFDPPGKHRPNPEALLPLDRYAIDLTAHLNDEIIQAYDDYRFLTVYQRLHHFCSIDMGAFYLDVIKDRLYTLPVDHPARRSAQHAMHIILEALVRWLAPICSFTAEEIHAGMNASNESIMLSNWSKDLPRIDDQYRLLWQRIRNVRDAVGPKLEALRRDKIIGSSLAAKIVLYADNGLKKHLDTLGDELRFVLLTSEAHVEPIDAAPASAEVIENVEGGLLKVEVRPVEYAKCIRCWHHRADIGSHVDHPEICGRCVENVVGAGEQRLWA